MSARWISSCLLVATIALAAACGGPDQRAHAATPVPNEHPASALAIRTATADEFAEEAQLRGLAFTCGKGEGVPPWDLCMLRAEGLVAVVGFGDTTGIDIRLTSSAHDGVMVPLAPATVYGVPDPGGGVRVAVISAGREIGDLASEL